MWYLLIKILKLSFIIQGFMKIFYVSCLLSPHIGYWDKVNDLELKWICSAVKLKFAHVLVSCTDCSNTPISPRFSCIARRVWRDVTDGTDAVARRLSYCRLILSSHSPFRSLTHDWLFINPLLRLCRNSKEERMHHGALVRLCRK